MDPKKLPKVLYIEDTPDARLLVRRVLEREFLVLEASDGLKGIELAIDTQPDLILVDINLPSLSGREVATRLNSLLPDTPLVALTADVTEGARERALAAGFAGFLSKPFEVDQLPGQLGEFINGKRETLEDKGTHQKAYQEEVAAHLEEKVRELTNVIDRNNFLNKQKQHIIAALEQRQRLLEAGARVARGTTSILDLNELLQTAVDIICEEFDFYYSGIYLVDEKNQWAMLRAGRGAAGNAMLAENHRLKVGGNSMIGTVIANQKARIVFDVKTEAVFERDPYLSKTRSVMALPLVVKDKVLGALSVQSERLDAFSDDDITALQSMADQIAIAIRNAALLLELDHANQEILRTKTYEAIATATGEAIHWVGNKAAPITGSIDRVKDDLLNFVAVCKTLLDTPDEKRTQHPFWRVIGDIEMGADSQGLDLSQRAAALHGIPAERLSLILGLDSILEDLEIIQTSASTILNIKEDLIGPGRVQKSEKISVDDLIHQTVIGMGLPDGIVDIDCNDSISIYGDRRQLERVFINLIKNAWEVMDGDDNPKIWLTAESADNNFVQISIKDNGPGIAPDALEKIWVSFYTTKGNRGGTGLGLSACMAIVQQCGGKIWVESPPHEGASFFVLLPKAKE